MKSEVLSTIARNYAFGKLARERLYFPQEKEKPAALVKTDKPRIDEYGAAVYSVEIEGKQ